MLNKINSFAFFVLAYNHEKYIIEHLESIKYLVKRHGADIKFQLIVSDDASIDITTTLIDLWLEENGGLFFDVVRYYSVSNIGTCLSVKNGLGFLQAEYCKITAGDDVYSFVNLFRSVSMYGSNDILSGIPLSLVEGKLKKNRFDILNMIASDLIYKESLLIERFKWIHLMNAPNIIYKIKYLKNQEVLNFIARFDVVEDWPLQIAIAECNPNAKYFLNDEVFVYYRRTLGSTYLVASDRFIKDQIDIFEYLLKNETSFFKKIVLKNRLFCFLSHSKLVKRYMNLARWVYVFKFFINLLSIYKRTNSLKIDVSKHRAHIQYIQDNALIFFSKHKGL